MNLVKSKTFQYISDPEIEEHVRNVINHPKPVYVYKDTRAWFTTSMCWGALNDGLRVVLVVPNYEIIKELVEKIEGKFEYTIFRGNKYSCEEIVRSNLRFPTKRKSCFKCKHWYDGIGCEYSHSVKMMEQKKTQLVCITYAKFMLLEKDEYLSGVFDDFANLVILDECKEIKNKKTEDMALRSMKMTGYDEVDNILIILRKLNIEDEHKFAEPQYDWQKYYQKEENKGEDSDPSNGDMITFLNGERYWRYDKGIKKYVNDSGFREWLLDVFGDRLVLANAKWEPYRVRECIFDMPTYYWGRKVRNEKHFVLIDKSSLGRKQVEKRLDALEKADMDPVVFFMNRKTAGGYASRQIQIEYYRGKYSKGITIDSRCLLLVGMPWIPMAGKSKEDKASDWEDIKEDFYQAADRNQDPNKEEFSFTFVMVKDPEKVIEAYQGEGKFVFLRRNTVEKYLDVLIDIIKDDIVELDDLADIAAAIGNKGRPGSTLCKTPGNLNIKYKNYIREKRKDLHRLRGYKEDNK